MTVHLKELRIAEALAALLCHELVSPVGAVANGAEILIQDPAFAADAAALIGQSAAQAAGRLQFYRLAFGALGDIAPETARLAAEDFFAEGRCRCIWPADLLIPTSQVKAATNLLLVAVGILPRGGTITIATDPSGVVITAEGQGARIDKMLPQLLAADIGPDQIGPKTVQAVFTGQLARACGCAVTLSGDGADRLHLRLVSDLALRGV